VTAVATYHVFARSAYADPLGHVTEVELDELPSLETLPVDRDPTWIELVVIPDDDIHWVIRDGRLVVTQEVPA
jgi:hypothetical protein